MKKQIIVILTIAVALSILLPASSESWRGGYYTAVGIITVVGMVTDGGVPAHSWEE